MSPNELPTTDALRLDETLVCRLSHRPRHLVKAMITIDCSARPIQAERDWSDRTSSLGSIDCLPPEIVSYVLDHLDPQSITRFSTVSARGHAFVRSHQPYQDLVKLCPDVLLAMHSTGVVRHHSVARLYGALRRERCVSCAYYGAFLFLPTCQRCCWECLRYNPSLRMVLPNEAKRYFGLTQRQLQLLPVFDILPGRYDISANPSPEPLHQLVSVSAARHLGLEVHRTAEGLSEAMARRCRSTKAQLKGRYLQNQPGETQGQDLLLLPTQGNVPKDDFFGMASITFPSLSNSGQVDHGLWCRGCEATLRRYDFSRLPQGVLAAVVPLDCEPQRVLLGLERRARSRDSFLSHVRHCYGAQKLLQVVKPNPDNV